MEVFFVVLGNLEKLECCTTSWHIDWN